MLEIPVTDVVALLWFAGIWVGYTIYTDRGKPRTHSLRAAMHKNRYRWMQQVLKRENRLLDANVLGQLAHGASFFASTSAVILVGLFTILGAKRDVTAFVSNLPFVEKTTPLQWELRLLVLIIIFTHAFFKFTWGLRQFNYCAVLVGAAPAAKGSIDEEWTKRTAWISTLASKDFNQGLRAYYFSLATVGWFVNAWMFMAATALTVWVLYYREYHSEALRSLRFPGELDTDKIKP